MKHTYTYHCPTCNSTRELKGNPKYSKTGNIRKCYACAGAGRKPGSTNKGLSKSTSRIKNDCIRTLSEVAALLDVSKVTVNNIETIATLKILDALTDYIGGDRLTISKGKGDPTRMAVKQYLMEHYMEEEGQHTVESCVTMFNKSGNHADHSRAQKNRKKRLKIVEGKGRPSWKNRIK